MVSRLRTHFGTAGLVVAVVALVAALAGGAVAANGGGGKATASAKAKPGPRGPKGAKGSAGAAGPAGPAGPAGTAGAAGPQGPAGANGTNGANGKTVLNGSVAPSAGIGTDGDFYIDTVASKIYGPKAGGAWPAGVSLKGTNGTNGTNGSPWTAGGTLPSGATETGTWMFGDESPVIVGFNVVPLSYPIPLQNPLGEADVFFMNEAEVVPPECDNPTHPGAPSAANPEADSGKLCVFTVENPFAANPGEEKSNSLITADILNIGSATTGAFLIKLKGKGLFYGTYAVTG